MTGFVIRAARILPLSTAAPREPVDLRIEGDRVVEVAPRLDVRGLPEHDAEGRWLLPGLWDHHVHLGQWTLASHRLDLSRTTCPEDALAMVRAQLGAIPDVPVVGWGHRSARWSRQPLVAELDAVSELRPVVLISGDGHHAWMNTVALRGLGLSAREAMVSETEWFATYPRLAQVLGSEGTTPEAYRSSMQHAAASGVVGVVDLEFDQDYDAWPARAAAGADLLRVRVGAYASTVGAFTDAGLRTGDPIPGCSPRITMGPLKVISDGSLNTRTAWCHTPYVDAAGVGAPNFSIEELTELARFARDHGLEMAIHAIGDKAATRALDAMEAVGVGGSIEHAQLIAREDCKRMGRLGLRASVQPAHLLDDRDIAMTCWPDRAERLFAFRWMLEDDVRLAFGSDAPVSPLDPWLAVAAACHRSGDEREPWHREQTLTVREALSASTDGHGTVGVGSLADLALLDADPFAAAETTEECARALRSMHVAATWVGGEQVYTDRGEDGIPSAIVSSSTVAGSSSVSP